MKTKRVSTICIALSTVLMGSALLIPSASFAVDNSVTRIAGATRYETMQQIAQSSTSAEATQTVVIASGENFPDALASSSLAGIYQSPILLTTSNGLSEPAKQELQRIKPQKAILVGGPQAVSQQTEQHIKTLVPEVERIYGNTRVETANQIFDQNQSNMSTDAIIATSNNFADALSIAPYAYSTKTPILLTNSQSLDNSVEQTIRSKEFSNIHILGGTSAISTNIENRIESISNASIDRVYGQTRYETSLNIAKTFMNPKSDQLIFATGENFADALAGGALAGKLNSPLLLINNDNHTLDSIYSAYEHPKTLTVLGGKNAIHTRSINYLSYKYFNTIVESPEGNYVNDTVNFNSWCKRIQNGYYGYTKYGNVLQCKYVPGDSSNIPRWRNLF